jgi:hypothetical protein
VLDEVYVVWASLLKESLEVVCKRLHLALADVSGGHRTCRAGATRFLVVTTVGCGPDPLKTFLASLLATPRALFSALDGDVRRPLPLIGAAITPGFKTKLNAHSMCAQESSLHTYHIKIGYRITNVIIYNIYYRMMS